MKNSDFIDISHPNWVMKRSLGSNLFYVGKLQFFINNETIRFEMHCQFIAYLENRLRKFVKSLILFKYFIPLMEPMDDDQLRQWQVKKIMSAFVFTFIPFSVISKPVSIIISLASPDFVWAKRNEKKNNGQKKWRKEITKRALRMFLFKIILCNDDVVKNKFQPSNRSKMLKCILAGKWMTYLVFRSIWMSVNVLPSICYHLLVCWAVYFVYSFCLYCAFVYSICIDLFVRSQYNGTLTQILLFTRSWTSR